MLHLVKHPLIENSMAKLRDIGTGQSEFRELCGGIAVMLCYEAARDWELETAEVEGWQGKQRVKRLSDGRIVLVPILRAGLGMCEGLEKLFPDAPVYHLGIKRNEETLKPEVYYDKLPPSLKGTRGIIMDPMLATGGSIDAAVERLKQHDCSDITLLCILAAPEGVSHLSRTHPELRIYAAALDKRLNAKGYILPGLGDAGDRMYGTIQKI